MQTLLPILSPILCLAISFSVVMSGMHAKELMGMVAQVPHIDAKVHGDASFGVDLHHHIDKQTLKTLVGDNVQVDSRSLRLMKKSFDSKVATWQHRVTHWWETLAQTAHVL